MFGSVYNNVTLVKATGAERWPKASKREVGERLAATVAEYLSGFLPSEPRTAMVR